MVPKNNITKKQNNPTCNVEIDGIVYKSIKEAAISFNTSDATIIRRLDSLKFPNYKRLSQRLR
jgi:DNA-binding MurR/RpiR family transcriptional regulator